MAIKIFKFENRTSDGENFLPIGRDDSPVYFVLYERALKVLSFKQKGLLFWSQTWFILGPMNSFFRALCVEYEIYWRVISPDRQKFFAIRRPIFKLEYFNNHEGYKKATYIF